MSCQKYRTWTVATSLCLIIARTVSPTAAQVGTPFKIVARSGDAAPDGNGTFNGFDRPVLNNDGLAAFEGFVAGAGNASAGVFVGNGVDPLRQLARRLDATPDNDGQYEQFLHPAINANGQVTFGAFLRNTPGGGSDDRGVFRADGLTAAVELLREGDRGPDDNGTFNISQDEYSGLNDDGQVAFTYTLVNGDSGVAIWTATVPEPATVLLLPLLLGVGTLLRMGHGLGYDSC